MGARSRHEYDRPVRDKEAAEARAYHSLAEIVFGKPSLVADRRVLGQLSQLLHAVGNELDHGRAVPPPVRRAARGLGAALRDQLEPRTGMAARSATTQAVGVTGDVGAEVLRAVR
ncbi:MAG TPA: hypothetical protein VFE65_18130 [Pseudonocardia sp.]|nr:hypothetical protein [Pseudonocardia sp.]